MLRRCSTKLLPWSLSCGWRKFSASACAAAGAASVQTAPGQDPLRALLREQLEAMEQAGTFKVERIITTAQGPSVGQCSLVCLIQLVDSLAGLMLVHSCAWRLSFVMVDIMEREWGNP